MVKITRVLSLLIMMAPLFLMGCSEGLAPNITPISVEPNNIESESAQTEEGESTTSINESTGSEDSYPVNVSVDTAYPASASTSQTSAIDPTAAFIAGPDWVYSDSDLLPFTDQTPFTANGKFLYYTNLQSDAQVYLETRDGYASLAPQFQLSSEADWIGENRVIFAAQGSNSGNWVIYEKQLDSTEPQLLQFDQTRLNWRPGAIDGMGLLFLSNRDQNVEIYRFDYGSNLITNISNTPSNEFDPHFSAENQKILFVTDRDGKNNVYTMGLDGANASLLIEFDHDIFSPRWSPDGEKVAFSALIGDTSQILVYSIASETIDRITDNLFDSTTPTWLDNEHIMYSSKSEEDKWSVFVANLTTNQISQLKFDDSSISRQYVRWQK